MDLRARGSSGRIVVREGQVVQAYIRGTEVRGVDAVFELLGWVDGGFIFRVGEVAAADNDVGLSTSMLLLEAARRADELAA
jgi:hypothetical protein